MGFVNGQTGPTLTPLLLVINYNIQKRWRPVFSPLHRQARARREYDSYISIHSEIHVNRVGQKVASVRVTRSV